MKKLLTVTGTFLLLQSVGYAQAILKSGSVNTQIVEGCNGTTTCSGTHSGQDISFGDANTAMGRFSVWHNATFASSPRFTMSSNNTAFQSFNNSLALFNRDNTTNNNWVRMNFCSRNSSGSDFDMVGIGTQIKNHAAGSETADFVVGTTHLSVEAERLTLTSDGRLGINSKSTTGIMEVVDQIASSHPANAAANAVYRYSAGSVNTIPNLSVINNKIGSGNSSARAVALLAGLNETGVIFDNARPFIFGTQSRTDFINDNIGTASAMASFWPGTGNLMVGPTLSGSGAAARLEVNSGTSCASGLRLSQLRTGICAPASYPGGGVLSVNGSGDVVLVDLPPAAPQTLADNGCSMDPTNTFVELGQPCGAPSPLADLHNDREIPLNNNNLIFKDLSFAPTTYAPFRNRVGIGTPGCVPRAKFEVIRMNENVTPYDVTNRAVAGINVDVADNSFGNGEGIGVYGESSSGNNPVNVGGDFMGRGGSTTTIGARGRSDGGNLSVGGWFEGRNGSVNYGIYAYGDNGATGGGGPSYAGYFDGDVFSTTGSYTGSDRRIKKNVEPISNALSLIARIQPKKYQFNTTVYPGLNLPANRDQYGVIAQELEEVLPTLVKEARVPNADKKGFSEETIKTVNYTELIPILIQAMKEQQQQIEALTAQVKANAGQQPSTGSLNVTLSEKDVASLDQNTPNPYSTYTNIGYYIPQATRTAFMRFTTLDGKVLKTLEVPMRGKGTLNVQTPDLASGTYLYSLIADGMTIDSKRMQVVK